MKRKLKGNQRLMDAIIPKNFPIGCRRPTPGEEFLESLIAPNTTVYTDKVNKVTETGFVDPEGAEHKVDAIVCATGFDTTWIPRFPLKAYGKDLRDVWAKNGATSYLAIAVPEVPNYFSFGGPVCITVSSNMLFEANMPKYGPLAVGSLLPIIEVFTKYIIEIITKMQIENIKSLSPKIRATQQFKEHHDLYVQRTAWVEPCSSWFKKGDPNGLLSMYPGSRVHFFELLRHPRYEDYEIEYRSQNQWEFLGNGFAAREFDGRDTTDYMGFLGGVDRQPEYRVTI